ncbi:hypothetical protein [Pseudonocardia sp. GCM10023141]|uniref:hypothetical protein n=1 Tax=Pseudonocardia sp. GCM10023141 TaxID=3252653 RepID=UPI003607DF41
MLVAAGVAAFFRWPGGITGSSATAVDMDFTSPNPRSPSGVMAFEMNGAGRIDMHLGPRSDTSYYATLTR